MITWMEGSHHRLTQRFPSSQLAASAGETDILAPIAALKCWPADGSCDSCTVLLPLCWHSECAKVAQRSNVVQHNTQRTALSTVVITMTIVLTVSMWSVDIVGLPRVHCQPFSILGCCSMPHYLLSYRRLSRHISEAALACLLCKL